MTQSGSARPSALETLRGAAWTCADCGGAHAGAMDLACPAPAIWTGGPDRQPNGALRLDGDFLSEDFCVVGGERFFIRCVLEIPVHGLERPFGFGCWAALPRDPFLRYWYEFARPLPSDPGPWPGLFGNGLRTFPETLDRPCLIHPRDDARPTVTLQDEAHEVSRAQAEGIAPERLIEIYAAYGHSPG